MHPEKKQGSLKGGLQAWGAKKKQGADAPFSLPGSGSWVPRGNSLGGRFAGQSFPGAQGRARTTCRVAAAGLGMDGRMDGWMDARGSRGPGRSGGLARAVRLWIRVRPPGSLDGAREMPAAAVASPAPPPAAAAAVSLPPSSPRVLPAPNSLPRAAPGTRRSSSPQPRAGFPPRPPLAGRPVDLRSWLPATLLLPPCTPPLSAWGPPLGSRASPTWL